MLFELTHTDGWPFLAGFENPRRVAESSHGLGVAPPGTVFFEHDHVLQNPACHDRRYIPERHRPPLPGAFELFVLAAEHIERTLAARVGHELVCSTVAHGHGILSGISEVVTHLPPGRTTVGAGPVTAVPRELPFDAVTYCIATVRDGHIVIVGAVSYDGRAVEPDAVAAASTAVAGVDPTSPRWGTIGRPGASA